jgi:hypothetical protein
MITTGATLLRFHSSLSRCNIPTSSYTTVVFFFQIDAQFRRGDNFKIRAGILLQETAAIDLQFQVSFLQIFRRHAFSSLKPVSDQNLHSSKLYRSFASARVPRVQILAGAGPKPTF